RLPLHSSPHIMVANALRTDWRTVLPPKQCSFILGNPPFVGKTYLTGEQRIDMQAVWGSVKAWGLLDFVCAWYWKAAEYIQKTNTRCAFVSTNSISQGEQPGVMWPEMFYKWKIKIHFAHRTFPWESEARGKAHVHVIILGFGATDATNKRIYDYDTDLEHPSVSIVSNISPYLVGGNDFALPSRTVPICAVPAIINGSKQVDGGFLTLNRAEKEQLLKKYPDLKAYIRPFIGSEEFINSGERWCLWLVEAPPKLIRENAELWARIEGVQAFRRASKKEKTRGSAKNPMLFGEIRPVTTPFLAIPEVSSERRQYIPVGFLSPAVIPSNKIQVVPDATMFHFGVISSTMHMAWMRQVTGRLESRYSYSAKIVYNNFPWPLSPSTAQREAIETAAQAVLNARAKYSTSTLAELYDPVAMPAALAKAHTALDRAVDRCYRKEPFESDRQRVEYLFQLYEQITAPLAPIAKPKRSARRKAIYGAYPFIPASMTNPVPNAEQAAAEAGQCYFISEEPPPYRTKT
ncbi:MAG: type IIL restriction-modification enzyme MmeI, partial [Verrucomicrobiota bacterium]